MIEIYFNNLYKSDDQLQIEKKTNIGFTVIGHSGAGKKGTNIICAGVSAITQTAVAAVTKIVNIDQKLTQKEGFLQSIIYLKGVNEKKINDLMIILNTMYIGLMEIFHNYPDSLQIFFEYN